MERTEIVTNGCTGNCCAKFHLPYTLEELKRCQTARDAGKIDWIDDAGEKHCILVPEELDFIIDMLIELGKDCIGPERGEPIIDIWNRYCERENMVGAIPTPYIMKEYFNNMVYRDGQIWANFFTCKHFDAVNKICTAYEQRPTFCKKHGVHAPCEYDGCQMEGSRCKLKAKQNELIHDDISNL